MAFKGLKKIFQSEEEALIEGAEDSFYDTAKEDIKIEGFGENKMILLEPRAYSEAQQIADYLKKRSAVVVNLKRVTPEQAKRIVDFLTGTIYAINGDLQKLGGGIFLCTPNNINVEGKISENGLNKKKGARIEEDDFNF